MPIFGFCIHVLEVHGILSRSRSLNNFLDAILTKNSVGPVESTCAILLDGAVLAKNIGKPVRLHWQETCHPEVIRNEYR